MEEKRYEELRRRVIVVSCSSSTVSIDGNTIANVYQGIDQLLKKELPKEALTCGIVKQLIRDYEESIELIALDL